MPLRRLINLICASAMILSAGVRAQNQTIETDSAGQNESVPSRTALRVTDNSVSTQTPQTVLKQYPAISRTHVAFVFANDVWCAPRAGGVAVPLTDAPGMKNNVLFSPDGKSVAFGGNLEGNFEIYTMPIAGGAPTRVTHLPTGEAVTQWTPDGKLLFYTNSLSFVNLAMQLFTVPATGGLPKRLAVPYGAEAAISADGEMVAYTPNWPNTLNDNWKHYRGGMALDIWLFNLRTNESRQVTNWEGTDTKPMWRGDVLYYVSDAGPESRLNIWEYNIKTGARSQVTRFDEYDVRNPSIGPGQNDQGEIVFQYGPELYLLDLGTRQSRVLEVRISEEQRRVKPANVDASKLLNGGSISPHGDRVAVSARGDVWVVPVANGSPRNLTATSGAFERDPVWSPDGKSIAYFSDATGEYELYAISADGSSGPRQLSRTGLGFKSNPVWSPDSNRIAFTDYTNTIFIHTIASNETRRVDMDEWGSEPQVNWSPDSSWLVYNKLGEKPLRSIWLYDVDRRSTHQVTKGAFDDNTPRFDRAGNYLFFLSTRNYSGPTFSFAMRQFIYPNEDTLVAVPLRKTIPSPLLPDRANNQSSGNPLIDLEGIEARAIKLPIEGWGLDGMAIRSEGNPLYIQIKVGSTRALKTFDLKTQKETVVAEGASSFKLAQDGRHALVFTGGTVSVADTASNPISLKQVSLAGMNVEIDRRAEWRQIFNDHWRLIRDYFYDEKMHGIDWPLMRRRYLAMVDASMTREDVNFVLSEMIGELSVSHAYGGGGDVEQTPRVSPGMLAADFELDRGAYRITRIHEGAAWDTNTRGPLSQPGIMIKPGDYLLAVNSKPVDTAKDPWAALVGMGGTDTTLTISDKPVMDSTARHVVVKPSPAEISFRYQSWIEANRSYIARKTGGRVGYMHLPAFDAIGLNSFVTQYYSQTDKEALIIDIRWSHGGWLPDMLNKLMDPRVFSYLGGRFSKDRAFPARVHRGPKCVLASGMSVSAGENFAYIFRKFGVGKIIGTRTGGLFVGLNGNPSLLDGGYFNIPNAPFYEEDGTWLIEGHGLDPDITVINDPSKLVAGVEPQLDAAIKQMMDELKTKPFTKAPKPAPRDRRRGIVSQPEK
ncbi:MAG TPA: PDZ domain-containing protein [Pyrinomonadaceae bacterium]|nr:PDZ domain-containing protein [Pyrinomonadaceae bacterium]